WPPPAVGEPTNTSSVSEPEESSGLESGSPESSRDSWDTSQSASEEQEVPVHAPSPASGEPTLSGLDDIDFPPLPTGNPPPLNPDELPITSCGRYVLPDGPPRPSPAAEKQPPSVATIDLALAAASAPQSGMERRDRSRSRSPRTEVNMSERAASSQLTCSDNKLRRPKPHELSSDSDAPPSAKSQKLGTPPLGKEHPPPCAGGQK
ncbi:hypothetical protein MTO96_041982, partial [Rhipicephalus appendiculatus]